MKKLLLLVTSFVLGFVLIGCSSVSKEEKKGIDVEKLDPKNPVTIKVGASNVPHAVLLEHVAPQLEKEGIKLDIITYQDYYIPNKTLNDKEIDINYFQHVPFLKNAIKENGYKIEDAGAVHLEPIGLYSKKVKNVKDLKDGAKVLVSNNKAEWGRVLKLLSAEGLVKIKDGVEPVYSLAEAKAFFKEQSDATHLPFIFLSAGVSAELFQETLKVAHEAGSQFNGVLCGRATWKEAVTVFADQGADAARAWLDETGRQNINDLNRVLRETAVSWMEKLEI